jgi:hypothetical protein
VEDVGAGWMSGTEYQDAGERRDKKISRALFFMPDIHHRCNIPIAFFVS